MKQNHSGRRLGEFVVEEKLGEGGFGVVYRATQPLLQRAAVIKVLHTELRASSGVTERFLREARLASQLDHPYAAHIYAFGAERDGLLWIAMELVRGSTLRSYLQAHGPLPLNRFVPLMERICEVVHTAHTQGIVHRDIKPSNVMVLSRAGRLLPKLLDFGIAKSILASDPTAEPISVDAIEGAKSGSTPVGRETGSASSEIEVLETMAATGDPAATSMAATQRPAIDETLPVSSERPANRAVSNSDSNDLTAAGAIMGSPHYMAPEQWTDAASAGPSSDLYAIAALAYESITGSVPFTGTFEAIRTGHQSGAVPPVGDGLPAALDEFFARALAKAPGDRFDDGLAMAAAFRDVSGLNTRRRPLPRIEEPVRDVYLAHGPQPIAEALSALESAREPRQARDALWVTVDALARTVSLWALAAGDKLGAAAFPQAVRAALRRLGTTIFETDEWLEIAGDVTAPHAENPELHPIPELVRFLHDPAAGADRGGELFARLGDTRPALADPSATDDVMHARLAEALATLSVLLRRADFVCDYSLLVVGERGVAEEWRGVRRARRTAVVPDVDLEPGRVVLVDRDGAPVLSLHPLIQAAPPSPGAAPELFLLAGKGEGGAQLTAPPLAFVRHDPAVFEWLRGKLDTTLEPSESSEGEELSPYLGLQPFSVDDARRFLGRERQVEAFVNRLRVQPLLAVVGQSGAGKSSFVQAGVIPALGSSWRAITLRPGGSPMAALAARLEGAGVVVVDDDEALSDLGALLRRDAEARGPVVLVVDQLEELFTLCQDREQRQRFGAAIASAASPADDRVRVILTLRDDFLVQADSLGALREQLTRSLQLLATPAVSDLERIISEPAHRAGYEFEDPGLPSRMVSEVSGQLGALALLSFTAAKLWQRRDRDFKRIPSRAYEAIGGVGGALAQHAEALLESLPAERRGLVRRVFLHLVTAEGTRAVLTREELTDLCGGGAATDVIETLIEGRLLVASESEQGDDQIEIIHEALLTAWPRLASWRRETEVGARLRDQLRGAVKQWEERGRDPVMLWKGELLADLERWRANDPEMTRAETAFADASRAEAARGRRLRRGAVIASLAVLSAGVLLLLILNSRVAEQRSVADDQRAKADEQREVAEAERRRAEQSLLELYAENGRQALLARDYFRAAAYLSAAYSRGVDSTAVRFMLAEALRPMRAPPLVLEHGTPLTWVSFSPDGSRLVTAGVHAVHQPKVWSVADGRLLYALPRQESTVRVAVFDPSGERLAITADDGVARVFRAADGEPLAELRHGATVRWVAFDPSGERLASAGADGVAKIWRLPAGDKDAALVASLEQGKPIECLDWSADGLATASRDGETALWDPDRGVLVARRAAHRERIFRVQSHPRQHLVVSASYDGDARLWNPRSGETVVARHGAPVFGATLDAAGELLATAGSNGTAKLWEPATGRLLATLEGHRSVVFAVSFAPDGERLLTTSWDGSARVWDRSGMVLAVLAGESAPLWRGQFDPTGQRIAVAGADGSARVWSVASLRPVIRRLPAPPAPVRTVSYSHDGALLTTTSTDDTVRVFDVERGEQVAAINTGATPAAVALPDGLVAVARGDQLSIISHSGDNRASYRADGPISEVRISPDGGRLSTLSVRGTTTVWAVEGDALEQQLVIPARVPTFDDRGELLAQSPDGDLVRWNPETRNETMRITSDPLVSVFSCTGDRVLGVTGGGVLTLWSTETETRLRESQLKPHHRLATADPACEIGVAFGDRGAPTVIDLETGRALSYLETPQQFHYYTMNRSGTQVALAAQDGIVVWDLERTDQSPAGVESLVRCTVPYQVVGAKLVPTPLAGCPEGRP